SSSTVTNRNEVDAGLVRCGRNRVCFGNIYTVVGLSPQSSTAQAKARPPVRRGRENGGMAGMWTLGGLRLRELLRRTARESWEDEVFGQAARLAFYHFIAIFPGLLVVLILLARMAETGMAMRSALATSFRELLPAEAAALVTGAIADLDANVRARGLLVGT